MPETVTEKTTSNQKIEADYINDITYHVLTSMRLHSKYRTKWMKDPDLEWYQKKMNQREGDSSLENIMNYDVYADPDNLIYYLKKENDWYVLH